MGAGKREREKERGIKVQKCECVTSECGIYIYFWPGDSICVEKVFFAIRLFFFFLREASARV